MKIIDPAIDDYMMALTPARHAVLAEMEAFAAMHKFPIVGPLVGRFLQQLVRLGGVRRVFEMGSGFGYSALWMALAMAEDGMIECTESNADNVQRGQAWIEQAQMAERVRWQTGDALELIAQAGGQYDLILNDVDKEQYPEALRRAWPKVRQGGVLITDNALWSGRMVHESPPAESTRGVLQINQAAYALPDALVTILPLRDGLLLAVKA